MSLSVPGVSVPVTTSGSGLQSPEGYSANVFAGKQEQLKKVCTTVESKGFIPQPLVFNEVSWFYGNLGIDDLYFQLESVETIADHILSLYAAKIFAFIKNQTALNIELERETEDGAVYINTSKPGISVTDGPQHERRIDAKYLDGKDESFRVESYRSTGTVSSSVSTQLRCYFVTKCSYVKDKPTDEDALDIRNIGDKTFLEKATEHTLQLYTKLIKKAIERTGPVIEMIDIPNSHQKQLVIAYRSRTVSGFLSAMSDLYHFYSLYSVRKYVEQFSNGVTIYRAYLEAIPDKTAPPIEISIQQIIREASLMYCLPITPFQSYFQEGKLSVQETIYGYVGWIFAQHFLNRLGREYTLLTTILDSTSESHQEVLQNIKKRLRSDTFTREYILEVIKLYPDLIRQLYINFAMRHYVADTPSKSVRPSLSYQRLQSAPVMSEEELLHLIKKTVSNAHEQLIFESYLTFNKHVLKTNFYQPTKVALSFRLDPSFLPVIEYPQPVFGMFLVVGNEFRGFHIRFEDVARGGIRLVRSRNKEAYSINLRSLLDENYGLAATQQRKNKDIPEGGSKGTILLNFDQQDKPKVAFEKYVDAVLDILLIPDSNTDGKEKYIDLYRKPEILFFGPDEGTADYMDWASQHARKRKAPFWKAFTTGKSQSLGGIPHDIFGMTTRSVHSYVTGIYKKLGIDETKVTKLQTGGPDGDLGSNEIKISSDKTIAIVDGSGVLYDSEGINRAELSRLAESRKMISNFDVTKLSKNGFRILVDDANIRLPDGTVVENGTRFRNEFHLNPLASADLFVPCGGRPEAVDLNNVHTLLKANGQPRFKYIVEGANLFFTQDARLVLEKAGVIVFKDASANKGGVTSSSLEVLAALAFADDEFEEHMQVKNGKLPDFYKRYTEAVQNIIQNNANLEFEALWRESQKTGQPKAILSDKLSLAIIKLNRELQKTSLWDNLALRKLVLSEAFPEILLQKLNYETLIERIPENYVRAIFGSYLASRFVYRFGIEPSQFAFFEFMASYQKQLI